MKLKAMWVGAMFGVTVLVVLVRSFMATVGGGVTLVSLLVCLAVVVLMGLALKWRTVPVLPLIAFLVVCWSYLIDSWNLFTVASTLLAFSIIWHEHQHERKIKRSALS